MGKCQLFLRYLVKIIDFFFRDCYNSTMEYDKTLTEILEKQIKLKYKNIKQFSDISKIPYMTISNVLKRGVENSSFGTIQRICNALGITFTQLNEFQAADTIKRKIIELQEQYTNEEFLKDLIDSHLTTIKNPKDFLNSYKYAKQAIDLLKYFFVYDDLSPEKRDTLFKFFDEEKK